MAPDVSIVVPCYNQGVYLAQSIESVRRQTFENWELIIVDDGSTDETPRIAGALQDPRIIYSYQDNKGLSAARNRGIGVANSPIIALLDSDDLWEPRFLERMLGCLIRNPDAAAVYCGHSFIDIRGCKIGSSSLRVVPPDKFCQTLIYEGDWLVPSAVVFRRDPAREAGLFDESMGGIADAEFWYRLSTGRIFIGIDEILVRYRIHEASMSMDADYMVTDFQRFIAKICELQGSGTPKLEHDPKDLYATFYEYAALKYGMADNLEKCAHYFLQLYETSPLKALKMGTWRYLIRVHLPPEDRGRILSREELNSSAQRIESLLDELGFQKNDKNIRPAELRRIKGHAFLSLAEESIHSQFLSTACIFLWRATRCYALILMTRPYWGTILRGISRFWTGMVTKGEKASTATFR